MSTLLSAEHARIKAGNDRLVLAEICAIQDKIFDAIDDNKLSVIINDSTPFTALNPINNAILTAGGEDYFPIPAEVEIDHDTGVGAELTADVDNDGAITGLNISQSGTGYDIAFIDATQAGNGDADIDIDIDNNSLIEGSLADLIINPGTGYTIGDALDVIHSTGSGAIIEVTEVGSNGEILDAEVIDGGSGYSDEQASISITHPYGTGFSGLVVVQDAAQGGGVEEIVILEGGAGYNDVFPTVEITDNTGQNASVLVTDIDETTGEILEIELIDGGFGYTDPSAEVIAASGSSGQGATVDLEVDESEFGFISAKYQAVSCTQEINREIRRQLDEVIKYFQSCGYEITTQVNPDTGITLQWKIVW